MPPEIPVPPQRVPALGSAVDLGKLAEDKYDVAISLIDGSVQTCTDVPESAVPNLFGAAVEGTGHLTFPDGRDMVVIPARNVLSVRVLNVKHE